MTPTLDMISTVLCDIITLLVMDIDVTASLEVKTVTEVKAVTDVKYIDDVVEIPIKIKE